MFNVDEIRRDFPILATKVYGKNLVYLDNAATTQKPMAVIDEVVRYYSQVNSNIHRGVHYLSSLASREYEAAREKVAQFINANSAREVVFTHGATESINLVANSFGLKAICEGDEIIVSEMEHHSNLVPWQQLCQTKGAVLKVLPFDDRGVLQVELLSSLLSQKTKLVAVTAVSNVLGTVNPIKEIVARAHLRNIPVLVDGAQSVQHGPTDVKEMDCDFFVFSGHKLFAETGIGVLYAKEILLDSMPPYLLGGGMIDSVDFNITTYTKPPARFEAGTPNICGALSLKTAISYVQSIGLEEIAEYEEQLLLYLQEKMQKFDQVTIYGNANRKASVLSFGIDGVSSFDAASLLDKMGVAVRSGTHCAQTVMRHFGVSGMIRASIAFYNNRDDIDAFTGALERVFAII